MVEIPDRLRCLFNTTLERRGDSYVLEIPHEELDRGEVSIGETYRVAVLPQASSRATAMNETRRQQGTPNDSERTPPVEEGEVREVEIETSGDQGDGIAKVERGYVLIVPETRPGDEVTIEIENVRENVAFAQVVDESATASNSTDTDADTRDEPASHSSPFKDDKNDRIE